jgi:glutamate transport system permease protein
VGAVIENLPLYLEGFRTTLVLTLISGVAALVLGTVVAALRVSPIPPLRIAGATYVEILRNTPLTLVFFFVVFVLPRLGLILPFFVSALVALSAYTATFVCEAVRSGINSVGMGQSEAARSIGLTFGQSLRLVILPQALRSVVPPLIGVFIALTKNSSIAGVFFVGELFNVGRRLATERPDAVVAVLLGVAFFYLLITVPAGALAARLERKVAFAR